MSHSKIVNPDMGSWAAPPGTISPSSPNASSEIKARARELWAEAPGENRRVRIRLFREFGFQYSSSTIYNWVRNA